MLTKDDEMHSFLDRINVSNARLAGMQKDLHMTDTQWSAGISMFYVGHLISQLPGNVILARGNPRILLPVCMLCCSAVTISMTALSSPWSFIFAASWSVSLKAPSRPQCL
jgi:sugar phosphate permease